VTPPSWRARYSPNWHMENLPRRVLPLLREAGATQAEIDQMLVGNPKRLLEPVLASASGARAPEEIR